MQVRHENTQDRRAQDHAGSDLPYHRRLSQNSKYRAEERRDSQYRCNLKQK
jgi:hypothetical protein